MKQNKLDPNAEKYKEFTKQAVSRVRGEYPKQYEKLAIDFKSSYLLFTHEEVIRNLEN